MGIWVLVDIVQKKLMVMRGQIQALKQITMKNKKGNYIDRQINRNPFPPP
jgi:hypothetical protein